MVDVVSRRVAQLRNEIVAEVEAYWRAKGSGPGRDHLAGVLGVSRGTVHTHVTALIAAGELVQEAGTRNTLRLPD